MRKLLFLTPCFPYPLNTGFNVRIFNILKLLSKRVRITLVCFAKSPVDYCKINILKEFCEEIIVVADEPKKHFFNKYPFHMAGLIYHLTSMRPMPIRDLLSVKMMRIVEQKLKEQFDIVWLVGLGMAYYIQAGIPVARIIIDAPNDEAIRYHRQLRYAHKGQDKIIAWIEYFKMSRYQSKVLAKLRYIVACSENEKLTFSRVTKGNIYVIPNGVDTNYFHPSYSKSVKESNLVFVGSMSYEPNADCMNYFCRELFSKIIYRIPNVKLYIVGRNPPENILKYHDGKNIFVTGEVKDIRDFYAIASVVIVPLRIGGGTRTKILEALAMGKPVISTSIGCEGIDLEPNKEIVIVDNQDKLAESCIELLSDVNRQRLMGARGRLLVEKKYDWTKIEEKIFSCIQEVS